MAISVYLIKLQNVIIDLFILSQSTSSVDGSCGSPPPAESTTLKSPPVGPPGGLGHLYHGTWPVDPPAAAALWHSGPASLTGPMYSSSASGGTSDDHGSVHSFSISHGHDLVEVILLNFLLFSLSLSLSLH